MMKRRYAVLEWFRRAYRDKVYAHVQNRVRGSNWILRRMTRPIMEQCRVDGHYCYSHDVELCFVERDHLNPTLFGDIVRGYLGRYTLEPSDTVVDGGAYAGTLAIYCAKQGADVVAVEPDPANIDALRANLRLNGVEDKVEVVDKALWEEESQISFSVTGSEESAVAEGGDVAIDATTLDALSREYGPFDFVKLDIEGAEMEALRGAEELLSEGVPFAIETQETVAGEPVWKPVEQFFMEHGYTAETGYPLHRTTWAWKE